MAPPHRFHAGDLLGAARRNCVRPLPTGRGRGDPPRTGHPVLPRAALGGRLRRRRARRPRPSRRRLSGRRPGARGEARQPRARVRSRPCRSRPDGLGGRPRRRRAASARAGRRTAGARGSPTVRSRRRQRRPRRHGAGARGARSAAAQHADVTPAPGEPAQAGRARVPGKPGCGCAGLHRARPQRTALDQRARATRHSRLEHRAGDRRRVGPTRSRPASPGRLAARRRPARRRWRAGHPPAGGLARVPLPARPAGARRRAVAGRGAVGGARHPRRRPAVGAELRLEPAASARADRRAARQRGPRRACRGGYAARGVGPWEPAAAPAPRA